MNRIKWIISGAMMLAVLTFALFVVIHNRRPPAPDGPTLLENARIFLGELPPAMPGAEHDTADQIALGRRLFFERDLSINRTQSCNDCHRIDNNLPGIDALTTSKGAHGQFGPRNSPTVLNAGFQVTQFWDGRAKDLAEQAKGPPLNHIEMAMPDVQTIEQRLHEMNYAPAFAKAFPNVDEPLTFDTAASAIAAFERTLLSRAPLDDYLAGDESALDDIQKQGLEIFIAQGCISCHAGPLLGGMLHQTSGLLHPYDDTTDTGRFEQTAAEADRFVFKVPMLRNVVLTAPYFHDGKVTTIEDAIEKMAWMQVGQKLTPAQTRALARFLDSTTDPNRTPLTPASPRAPAAHHP